MKNIEDMINGTLSTNFEDDYQTPVDGLTDSNDDIDQDEIEDAAQRILAILKRKK